MAIKIEFTGTVKRVYSETSKSGYESNYIVVTSGGERPNVIRFRLKPTASVTVVEGAEVKVTAFVDGREWVNSQGVPMYFTDFTVATIDCLGGAMQVSAPSGGKPTKAHDWDTLSAVGTAFGETREKLIERCNQLKAQINRKFTEADWQTVADRIVADHNPPPAPASAPQDLMSDEFDPPF